MALHSLKVKSYRPINTANNTGLSFFKNSLLYKGMWKVDIDFRNLHPTVLRIIEHIAMYFCSTKNRLFRMNLYKTSFLIVFLILASAFRPDKNNFETIQRNFYRVNNAYFHKEDVINDRCKELGIPVENFGNIFIRAFKQERTMEIWVQRADGNYVLFNEYRIYSNAGKLGPKRTQGDYQVPEGFYYITDFNPQSSYYLSLGINYPNESDSKLSNSAKKGGSIYIHGSVVSAGCLAMSDYYIEDIYICCVKARSHGQQRIPVQIYPFKLTSENLDKYTKLDELKQHKKFWENLAEGYKMFENNCCLPDVAVGPDGYYQFADRSSAAQLSK